MMIKKSFIPFIALLLAVLPVLVIGPKTAEAATSRVVVLKEVSGAVKVKKSGGTKEFTAFAKMSLNEGDLLMTGGKSSAVLQFANGTSTDDQMTVSQNTTLSFSKLSDRNGTKTKVSMFNGSAWVDVKSIVNKEDEFSLETPTAVMGVRGTHLLVKVDPITGATHLVVAAGVVNTKTTDPDNPKEEDVYPTQNAYIGTNAEGEKEITIALLDLERLFNQSDASIAKTILESAADINDENGEFVKKYDSQGLPSELGDTDEDLVKFQKNTESLIGVLANKAIQEGLISSERVLEIIQAIKNGNGSSIDLSKRELELSEEDRKKKEIKSRKMDEGEQRALDRRKKEEEARQAPEDVVKKTNDAKKKAEEAKKKALEEAKKKAEEEYYKQLSEAEKQRFEADKKANGAAGQTPSSNTGSSTEVPSETVQSDDATLSGLEIEGLAMVVGLNGEGSGEVHTSSIVQQEGDPIPVELSPSFQPSVVQYVANVGGTIHSVKVKPTVKDAKATVEVLDQGPVVSGSYSGEVILEADSSNVVSLKVTAGNGAQKTYSVRLNRPPYTDGENEELMENHSLSAAVTGYDEDGDSYTFGLEQDVLHGALDFNPNTGEYTYTPEENYSGPDSFNYTVSDGNAQSYVGYVNFTVARNNHLFEDVGVYVESQDEGTQGTIYGSNAVRQSKSYWDTLAFGSHSVGLEIFGNDFEYTYSLTNDSGEYVSVSGATYIPIIVNSLDNVYKLKVEDSLGQVIIMPIHIYLETSEQNTSLKLINNNISFVHDSQAIVIISDIDSVGPRRFVGIPTGDSATLNLVGLPEGTSVDLFDKNEEIIQTADGEYRLEFAHGNDSMIYHYFIVLTDTLGHRKSYRFDVEIAIPYL
ncbi:Ig-like domain-containing protein [Cohnella lupini]|uniref:FecR family protein n=1 Tax=Cohnella lupini TaxID=1294267 RepID=A0A3D9ITQ0_9BACL|nr:Ig-like domain-containing protein [Cohnella lupini]RED65027.1 FecR family protein [Cohnella lupini]